MKVTILGRNGLLGKALWERCKMLGYEVYPYPRIDADYVFWFSSPSSQIIFKQAPEYSFSQTIQGFMIIKRFCTQNNIKLIYPLTASSNNDYANSKLALEGLQHFDEYRNILGVKISAGYGNEEHKGEYASVIYQFCKMMKRGERPIIFGDGTQTRDFVYVEDIVDNILISKDETGIVEIGSGTQTPFNEIVDIINRELGTSLLPVYVDKPESYLQETKCKNPKKMVHSLREGIREVLQCI